MKSLSLLYLKRERPRPLIIQDMSYDYKKATNTGKNEKFAQKVMHENDIPPIN